MQIANVKGKDETYACRLHCLPLYRQPLRRRVVIVGVSLGACRRYRLSAWRSEQRGIGARRTRDWQDGQLGLGKWASC